MWRRRLLYAYGFSFFVLIAVKVWCDIVFYEVASFAYRDIGYSSLGAIPPYASTKLYISFEALWDVEGLRDYVAGLAAYDLADSGNIYAVAAFDLASADKFAMMQGRSDWKSFLSPAQAHAHDLVIESPVSWAILPFGSLQQSSLDGSAVGPASLLPSLDHSLASASLVALPYLASLQRVDSDMPATIYLVSRLRAGTRKQSRKEPAAGWCATRHRPLKPAQSGCRGTDGKLCCSLLFAVVSCSLLLLRFSTC